MVRVKDGSASSCRLACFTVVIIVVFNCLPTIFFALYSRDNSNELESTHTHSQGNISLRCGEQRVKLDQQFSEVNYDFFLSSACQSYLPWMNDLQLMNQGKDNFSGFIVVDNGCGLQRTETELERLFAQKSLITRDCFSYGLPFICSYYYRPLVNDSLCNKHWPTKDECTAVKTVHCQSEWRIVKSITQSSDVCIPLPDCTQLPARHQNETNIKTFQGMVSTSVVSAGEDEPYKANGTSSCIRPLISSTSSNSPCSPPCPIADWLLRKGTLSLIASAIYISLVVICICSFIVFYTWAKVKELRQFPHSITLLMVVFYMVTALHYAIAFSVGRRGTYCSHSDALGTWENPSTLCIVQVFQISSQTESNKPRIQSRRSRYHSPFLGSSNGGSTSVCMRTYYVSGLQLLLVQQR
ncbi:uncharacterized protein LOC134183427 [Corticium candelabrum]|uniref:uncharacterized protein LOC134183427 n=1 Tax=Corticium candelabrum TaxID=121492 RepID=UPI002E253B93|nr:uncharacterized protein LOC134183427 [Corticium candelabrum]